MRKILYAMIAGAVVTIVVSVSLSSCKSDADYNIVRDKAYLADSMIREAFERGFTHEQLTALADSLYEAGDISVWKKAIVEYSVAEDNVDVQKAVDILKAAVVAGEPQTERDTVSYFFCVTHLAYSLAYQERYEEALRTATDALERVKQISNIYYRNDLLSNLFETITNAQAAMRMMDEAERTAEEAYAYSMDAYRALPNAPSVIATMSHVSSAITRLQDDEKYEAAEKWLARYDSLVAILDTLDDADPAWKDMRLATNYLLRAKNDMGLKRPETAEKAYQKYLTTDYAKTRQGELGRADYLMLAGRWSESSDQLQGLEDYYNELGIDMSLDVLRQLNSKFKSNYHAGRRDSALHVANYILENLDSAIIHERESNTAEMATIYETQKKDAEIAQQKIALSQQRLIGLVIAIILLTIFFIIYTLVRRRAAKRMAEMRAEQERIENELQIARNIQMSMVPSTFPDYEGLDMYASMTPAKEVGGDLYGYVLIGDKLYFALGDVSGKGVPASLFMAQATRLFRTLAAQQMMPAEICTRMNEALSGDDNESGMFVTFWLGLLDLKTGHLNFCNAGHNPPVIGGGENDGDFLKMIPNTPIGLWPGMEFKGEEIDTIKGRTLFIYTDGLNEAENRQQEQFGDERLLNMLRTTHFDTAQSIIDALKAEVEKHRNGAEPNDDLTMMCVKIS